MYRNVAIFVTALLLLPLTSWQAPANFTRCKDESLWMQSQSEPKRFFYLPPQLLEYQFVFIGSIGMSTLMAKSETMALLTNSQQKGFLV